MVIERGAFKETRRSAAKSGLYASRLPCGGCDTHYLSGAERKTCCAVMDNVIRQEYGQVAPTTPPRWMIDAGADIGDTTAYFLSKYPSLKAVVLQQIPLVMRWRN